MLQPRRAYTSQDAVAPEGPPTVPVVKVTRDDLSTDLNLTGEFEPYQEVDVMSKVAGYLKSIQVDIGDRVHEGQVLATLEIPEMADEALKATASTDQADAEVSTASDQLHQAEAAHEMAHLSYTRILDVSKKEAGLVPQEQVDEFHSRDLVAEAQVAAAKSNLRSAQQRTHVTRAEQGRLKTLYNYATITTGAGCRCRHQALSANTGSMIQAGTASQSQAMPVIRLSQNNLLRLILPVPESVVPHIHIGGTVDVHVTSLGRTFPGRVVRFTDKIQLSTRTMDTEVDVPNPQPDDHPRSTVRRGELARGGTKKRAHRAFGRCGGNRRFRPRVSRAAAWRDPFRSGVAQRGNGASGWKSFPVCRKAIRRLWAGTPASRTAIRCNPRYRTSRQNSMSRFAIRTPYLHRRHLPGDRTGRDRGVIRMPVDLFPAMNIPVVAVATFYPGMPPEQIEGNITFHLERFFTLASGIDHMGIRGRSPA